MTATHRGVHPRSSNDPVIDWLLDADPSIRWQVMRDLTETPAAIVAAERSRVASEGWGSRLLDQQRPDGQWGDGVATPFWWSNLYTLLFLRDLGLDPTSERARTAIDLVRDDVTWGPEFGDSPFFEGLSKGKLMGSHCPKCDYTYATPRGHCMECGGRTEWVELPLEGKIHTWTTCYYGGEVFLKETPFNLVLEARV